MTWHQQTPEQLYTSLNTSAGGLTAAEAARRLEEHGPNQLEEKKKKPAWLIFLGQFKDFMIVILAAAAVISGIVGDVADTVIILVIVLLNAIVGFLQEYRAEKAMDALKKLASPQTRVLRDGHLLVVPSFGLVPGDIVLLEAGVLVPADLRLTEVHSLRIDEASLTGESIAVDKSIHPLEAADPPLADRVNMAYKGTQVINGRGTGVVVGSGMQTEIGKIAKMLQGKEAATPLQKRMGDFGKKLSWLIIGICVLLFLVGLARGERPMEMLLVAISLAVAAIPEALPALITIALARGAKRLVQKNALIRRLHAVETLGSVTYICTDKTGTLTQNKMKVTEVRPHGTAAREGVSLLTLSMALNHDVQSGEGGLQGDPTEIAMVEWLGTEAPGADRLAARLPRAAELPFDSDRKLMTTIHRDGNGYLVITKGAVESLLGRVSGEAAGVSEEAEDLARSGMRVLAFGFKELPALPDTLEPEAIERDLQFSGLVAMIDPPRAEAKAAIGECRTAGIQVVMITGDHKETATAIAREIGILSEGHRVTTGSELKHYTEEDWAQQVEHTRVYARVSPEQKLNIVKALQAKGHFVSMTGDGVNDAPSLKTANIGVAMGITGTDVSKEAAHMILLDDNFATIVKAVKEGRRIYDNIRRFVKYIMTCNSAEIWTIFLAPLLGLPIPLLPVHILWINLVTDGLPGLALSAEGAERNIMRRPPRRPAESIFAGGTGIHILWVGVLMAAITLGTQAWAINNAGTHWQTMVFTVLSLAQLAHVFAIRSD
ncbi:MAG TPA: cation-translocating P-type ATPase, partial [Chitinophagaceae bacterium]|nr:cation-translocating P-type ATPase [Chitinophagaceae bacterium]